MAIRRFAAIDVGSFELELGIYEISKKYGVKRIDYLRHVIALGKDTYNNGKISYPFVDEICRILSNFSEVMKTYQVSDYRAYGTSAMREAANKQIVLDQIKVRTGIDVTIISNSEQRFISFKAIAAKEEKFDQMIQKGTAIADVGFGSMQISLFDKAALVTTQNLMLGVLRIKELLLSIPTNAKGHDFLVKEIVDNELFAFRKMYLKEREIKHIVGVGESILYLVMLLGAGQPIEYMKAEEFYQFHDQLLTMSLSQIAERFGVNTEHVSLLLPGAFIYRRILELTKAETLWIPGIRMCDGIAAEYAHQCGEIRFNHSFKEDILTTARNMAKRYKCHLSHVQMAEVHVLQLFDSMKRYHGLSERERFLLQIATIIHDCGMFISMKNPGMCAYNIIMSTEIIGISHREREVVANVVRYAQSDFNYGIVQTESENHNDMILISKFIALLGLANAMDRSHKQKLSGCRIRIKNNQLIVQTDFNGNIALEEYAFEQKAEFFEEIFGIRPILNQKRRR